MEFDHYQVLGVARTASENDIRAAFKSLAKKYHPDKHQGQAFYEEHFKKINLAYQVLSDKNKKSIYDRRYYSQSTNIPKSSPEAKRTYTYSAKKSPPKNKSTQRKAQSKGAERKAWIVAAIGILTVIVCGTFLYFFMNHYTANLYYEEGLALEKDKAYIPAMEKYSEALGFEKDFVPAYIKRGKLRMAYLYDYQGAFNDFGQALKYSEKPDFYTYFYRGKCLVKLEKYSEALEDFVACNKLNQFYDSAYFYRAEIENFVFEKPTLAIKNYNKVIKLNPKSAEAYFGRGYCYQALSRHKEAIRNINTAISSNENEGEWFYYRALSKLALADTTSSCDDLFIAIQKKCKKAYPLLKNYCNI
ncbi:MAG TPA: DnaJ domain-containing protein [Cytophagaceae bacterium]|jgi:curved DNA-binding protein CbpA